MNLFRFVTAMLTVFLGVLPAEAQEADLTPLPPAADVSPKDVFEDEFAAEDRGKYRVQGEVAWRNGELQLSPNSGVFKSLEVGDWVRVELSSAWRDVDAQGSAPDLQVFFFPDNTTRCMFKLRAQDDKGTGEVIASVVDTKFFLGFPRQTPIKTAPVRLKPTSPLVFEYRHGLLSLYQGDTRLFVAAIDKGTGDIKKVAILVGTAPWSLKRLRVSGNSPQPTPTAEEQRQLTSFWKDGERLAELHAAGRFREMKPIAENAYEGYRRILGERHPLTVNSLDNAAFTYLKLADYPRAEKSYSDARKIRRQILGPWHLDYSLSTNNLAALYLERAEYGRALPLIEETIRIREAVQGSNHPDVAINLNNLAYAFNEMGDLERAIPMYLRAVAIEEKAFGRKHPRVAVTLNNLALAYRDRGDAVRAEALFQEVIDIEKIALGPDNPARAVTLNNLALLYQLAFRDLTRAAELHLKAIAIREKALGKQHPLYAQSLNNLSSLYQATGDYGRAEELLLEALAIREAKFGKKHPAYAWTLQNLASLYLEQGAFAKAESLARETLAIRQNVLGPAHWDTAEGHQRIGEVLIARGEFADAREQFSMAWKTTKERLGARHPRATPHLTNIARTHLAEGDFDKAEPLLREVFDAHIKQAQLVLPALSTAQAISWVRGRRVPINLLFEVFRSRIQDSPDNSTAAQAYRFLWSDKALLSRLRVSQYEPPVSNAEAHSVFSDLRGVRLQLARLAAAVPPTDQRRNYQARLSEVSDRKERLEKRLAGLTPISERNLLVRDARVRDLLNVLPPGVAIIDTALMVDTKRLRQVAAKANADKTRVRVYEAFVLRSDRPVDAPTVQWIHLGPADAIDAAITSWRQRILRRDAPRSRQIAADNQIRPEDLLKDLLWKPLQAAVQGCHTIIILPDGQLGRLPWGALPGREANSFLIEDYAIGNASFGQQLFALLTAPAANADGELLLMGGVNYDVRNNSPRKSKTAPDLLASTNRGSVKPVESQSEWPFLPGAEREANEIMQIWGERGAVTRLSGGSANELALAARLPRSRYVHLATHGFFDQTGAARARGLHATSIDDAQTRQGAKVNARNPLLLSGIVLAGANLGPALNEVKLPTGEDGILTAEELVGLDLQNTELVTMSACETGLGRIAPGEGVFGLSHALHQAGVRSVVSSLWKVDDQATRVLMTEFYQNLWHRRLSKLQALRAAQLKMIREYAPAPGGARGIVNRPIAKSPPSRSKKRLAPYYWSAFQLSGDWR